jgi:hypothetical protein
VRCTTTTKTVKRHGKPKRTSVQKCTTKLVSSPAKFTAASARATISRGSLVVATGTATIRHGTVRLQLSAADHLRPGRYTLTLIDRHHRTQTTIIVA